MIKQIEISIDGEHYAYYDVDENYTTAAGDTSWLHGLYAAIDAAKEDLDGIYTMAEQGDYDDEPEEDYLLINEEEFDKQFDKALDLIAKATKLLEKKQNEI